MWKILKINKAQNLEGKKNVGERSKTETLFFKALLCFDNQVTDHKSQTTKKYWDRIWQIENSSHVMAHT